MKKIVLILIGIHFSFHINAQESISLSLEQAIDYALKNSYASINASRDIDAAKLKNGKLLQWGFHKLAQL